MFFQADDFTTYQYNKQKSMICTFTSNRTSFKKEETLSAYWEIAYDPISDDYTPHETNAEELFNMWAKEVTKQYDNLLIPIYWQVQGDSSFEHMPFQFHGKDYDNFLTIYTWPVHKESGKRLDWLTLPVVDKLWNVKKADKGGFIQEFTGWKPSIFQPYVFLPSLQQYIQK